MGGVTYSAQYTTDSKETLENIIKKTDHGFRAEIDKLEIKFCF
jgi:hypothetical protein